MFRVLEARTPAPHPDAREAHGYPPPGAQTPSPAQACRSPCADLRRLLGSHLPFPSSCRPCPLHTLDLIRTTLPLPTPSALPDRYQVSSTVHKGTSGNPCFRERGRCGELHV